MGMVAPPQRIASAYAVFFGQYGDVSRYARQRGVCRQWVYREADGLLQRLAQGQQEIERLRQQVCALSEHNASLAQRLALTVVLDKEKQAEFASVCQAV